MESNFQTATAANSSKNKQLTARESFNTPPPAIFSYNFIVHKNLAFILRFSNIHFHSKQTNISNLSFLEY